MIFKNHILFAQNCALMASNFDFIEIGNTSLSKTYFLIFLAIGAIFPDIDEPKSFFGRKFPGISHFLNLSIGHRGFTHFFIFPASLFGLCIFLHLNNPLLYGFILGVFLHQIGDLMTKSGISYYFFPFKGNVVILPKQMRFKTAGVFEYFILLPFLFLSFLILLYFEFMEVINVNAF